MTPPEIAGDSHERDAMLMFDELREAQEERSKGTQRRVNGVRRVVRLALLGFAGVLLWQTIALWGRAEGSAGYASVGLLPVSVAVLLVLTVGTLLTSERARSGSPGWKAFHHAIIGMQIGVTILAASLLFLAGGSR